MPEINGTDGNDVLTGSASDETINGFAGADDIDPGTGWDIVYAGDGIDTIRLTTYVNDGAPVPISELDGGAGSDMLTVQVPIGVTLNWSDADKFLYVGSLIYSLSNIERIVTTQAADKVTVKTTVPFGTYTFSLAGGDDFFSLDGAAEVDLSIGNDTCFVTSTATVETIAVINGSDGVDTLRVDFGATVSLVSTVATLGLSTYNVFNFENVAAVASNIEGQSTVATGDDYVNNMFVYKDKATATSTGVTFHGRMGNDRLAGSRGRDALYGEEDNDTVIGQGGDDLLDGGLGNDRLQGGSGNDTMYGGDDNDRLLGGLGDDAMFGGNGVDSLDGGAGADTMQGGGDNDTYYVNHAGDQTIETEGAGTDTVRAVGLSWTLADNIETLIIANGNFDGTGNALANTLSGSNGANRLSGLDGADTLKGLAGNDTLLGGTGADTLNGGTGTDTLSGEAGADTFVFLKLLDSAIGTANADVITDFSHAEGDRIDLAAIDAVTTGGNNDAFTFIGTAQFSHTAGELRYRFDGTGNTIVSCDVNGDGAADMSIVLTGEVALVAGDFVL